MSDPAFIALMGETGSGKTTFMNRATNSDAFLVGSGLHSCTSEIQVSPQFLVDGHPVILVDTPGFNDTVTSDAEVLRDISAFLAMVYEREVKLAGVIYFHRISDERWKRSDTRSFGWLRRICGETTLRNVVLTTNMWGKVTPEVGAMKERQLAADFVKSALDKGAQLRRHHDTTESAHRIIRGILNNRRAPLQVQRELVDEERVFDQTTVGAEIRREVSESTKALEEEIEELRNMLKTEKRTRAQLEVEITELRARKRKLTNLSRDMNTSYARTAGALAIKFGFLFVKAVGVALSSMGLGAFYWVLRWLPTS